MITVNLVDFHEGKYMQRIHFLHYQEDLHLYRLEMQISLDSQTLLIGTNAVLALRHISNPGMYLDIVD